MNVARSRRAALAVAMAASWPCCVDESAMAPQADLMVGGRPSASASGSRPAMRRGSRPPRRVPARVMPQGWSSAQASLAAA